MSPPAEDTLVALARELLLVLEPLRLGFTDQQHFRQLFYALGWKVIAIPQEYADAGADVSAAIDLIERMADGPIDPSQAAELLGHVVNAYEKLDPLPSIPPGMDPAAALEEVGKNLSDLLICEYLGRTWPQAYALLRATEIIELEHQGDTATQHGYVRSVIHWDQIPKLLQDPHLILQRVYGWGTDILDMDMICHHLASFLAGVGFPVRVIVPDRRLIGAYVDDSVGFVAAPAQGLKWPFAFATIGTDLVELSFQLLPLAARDDLKPGLVIQPGIPSTIPLSLPLGTETTLEITAGSDIAQQFGILIRPEGLGVKYPFMDASTIPTVTFGVTVSVNPSEPQIIFGTADGIRLEMRGFSAGITATGPVNDIALKLSLDVKELTLVLAAGEGDAFLQKLLPGGDTKVAIPLGIDWTSDHGFGFRGSLNFEVALHPHLQLGPVEIPDLKLSMAAPAGADPKARIEAALTLNGDLGPLKVVVQEMGFGVYARFTPGNAGPLDLSLGFKPPSGVGLSIDAGAVQGGGFLFFDADRQEYAGVLQLSILDKIDITAVGLITTKMPDGSKGFSLLVILSVEFNPGIQLGLGFALNGLGGLLGLNRTVMVEPLLAGVRTGALNSILFPAGDIIANAPRLLSDLRTIFPPFEGTFLVGPMAKIGWGTPTIVTVSVGVVIEIPGNVIIVGVLRMFLPTPDDPILVIQVAFAGAIEFDQQRLYFFAALFDSRVLSHTLEGEMGLLFSWSDDGALLFTIGGFHPRFMPPPLPFPSPARLALTILDEARAKIRLEAYLAVTSNTAQVGAQVELNLGFSSFGVSGHLGFDALFQFVPFYFVIDVNVSLSLKVAGLSVMSVRVDLTLEGPTPWHAHGTGHVSFFFFSISADFDVTWSFSLDAILAPIALLPLLLIEFAKRESWTTVLPPANTLLVSLRGQEGAAGDIVLHPLGTLRVSQRLLPLGIPLDKLGSQKPSDAKRFELIVGGGTLEKKADAAERFAMAQFQDMDDAEKLSRPSFEPVSGGLDMNVAGSALATDHMARRIVRYEEILIDSEYKRHQRVKKPLRGLFGLHVGGSAVTKSPLSKARRSELDPFAPGDKMTVTGETFAVVSLDTNLPHSEAATSFASEAEARDYVSRVAAGDQSAALKLQVVPAYEAA